MKRLQLVLILLLFVFGVRSQNLEYVKMVTDTLSSPSMFGRGYYKNGERKAADFIRNEFEKFGLLKKNDSYFQYLNFDINTFPSKVSVKFGKEEMVLAQDYLVGAGSCSMTGTFSLVWLKPETINNPAKLKSFFQKDLSEKFVVVDIKDVKNADLKKAFGSLRFHNEFKSKGIVFISDEKLVWSVYEGSEKKDYVFITVKRDKMPAKAKKITVDITSKFIRNYPTQNVIGYVKGKQFPDSFIVFTAHYDHLGQLGPDVMFPGGNDNASGTAALLDLAAYYSKPENQPANSIAFMAFTGEEAGLLGSTYYCEHPTIPLENMKFVVNLDMVGTGSKGIMIVNGQKHTIEFDRLVVANNEFKYMETIGARGESANSDHHPFDAKGVKAFFIYTTGDEYKEYHVPTDIGKNVPFTNYTGLFRLLNHFVILL